MLSKSIFSISGRSGLNGTRAASLRDEIEFLCSRVADRLDSSGPGPAKIGLCCTFPGEGTTTVAANLAIALADDGKRVILAEANHYSARLAEHFDIPSSPGLWQLRWGEATVQEISYPVTENLVVIPLGKTSIARKQRPLEDVAPVLGDVAEVVIFDLPPLSQATDTGRLMRDLDAMVLVVRANRTRKGDYLRSVKTLRELGALLAGTVLNDIRHDLPPLLSRML